MARDAIDDWSDGATGSITYDGVTTTYTVSTAGAVNTNDAAVLNPGQSVTVTFDDPLPGLAIRVGDLDAAFGEEATFVINGVPVNLEQAIANGDVVLTRANGAPLPNNGLDNVTGTVLDGIDGAQNQNFLIQFNTPITTIDLNYLPGGSGLLGFDAFVCFARGVLIETQSGACAVEDLSVGDLVRTADRGYQSIRWIGSRKLDRIDLTLQPKLRPICISAGALGQGVPSRDLRVSPQHRILARSKVARRMFDADEVLIPANKLLPLDGVTVAEDADSVEYFHILFDQHEVIFANGTPTESLFTGPEALKSVSPEQRAEICALFPEISTPDFHPESVRHIPSSGKQLKAFAQRHLANRKQIYSQNLTASSQA
jgi:hypothetical protein